MFTTRLDLSGQVVASRFELEEKLGGGGLTSSYSALDMDRSGARVFIKLVGTAHPHAIDREVFRRDVDRLHGLNHANISPVIESGWSEGLEAFYLVAEYLPHSLETYIAGGSSEARFDLRQIMYELAEALMHAHSQGIAHGSIRPSNVLLDDNGRPCLTDFGIRKLVDDLNPAAKVQRGPDGYTSPEERAGNPVLLESDLYSLGALYFSLLTGEVPPSEGLRPAMVDNYVSGQSHARTVLRGMVAEDPDERSRTREGLLATLQRVIQEERPLPRYFLVLTNRAIRSLYEIDRIGTPHFEAAANAVERDLITTGDNTVHVQDDPWNEESIFVMGSSLRLICRADAEGRALIVVAIHSIYLPEYLRSRERALPCRGLWIPVISQSMAYGGNNPHELLTMVSDPAQPATVSERLATEPTIEQLRSRSEYIEHWRTVLDGYAREVGQAGLSYSSASAFNDGYVRFDLDEQPPTNPGWRLNEPLVAVATPRDGRSSARLHPGQFVPTGNLVDINERHVLVDATDNENLADIPSSGKLMPNPIGHLTAIDRQRRAIQSFLSGEMANTRLADIVLNPSHATRLPENELTYFQDWMSPDKRSVVRKALASNDLFLVQGPPGTGKTTVIAEIILQLLRKNPHQRILMTSQSNIAVDHALVQVSKANQDVLADLEMLRLGNAQNLDGRAPTLEEKCETSRSTIVEMCDNTLDRLSEFADRYGEQPQEGGLNAVPDGSWVDQVVSLLDVSDDCAKAIKMYEPLFEEAVEWVRLLQDDLKVSLEYRENHLRSLEALLATESYEPRKDVLQVIGDAELVFARYRTAVTLRQLIERKRREGLRYAITTWIRRLFGNTHLAAVMAEAAAIADRGTLEALEAWIQEAREMVSDERARRSYLAEMLQRREVLDSAVKDAKERFAECIARLSTLLGHDEDWDDRDTVLFRLSEKAKLQLVERVCQVIGLKIARVTDVIADWKLVAGHTPDFENMIVEQCNVVGATCVYAGSRQLRDTTFDWAIIDEAGRATAPETLIPIVRSKGIILVGDERQLPPTIDELMNRVSSDISSEYELDESLFQSMLHQVELDDDAEFLSADLRTQYRMHPAIGDMISAVFYGGRLEQGVQADERREYAWLPRPVTWVSTSTLSGKTETPVGTSFSNGVEVEIIYRQLRTFETIGREQGLSPTVGVISGYAAQLGEIERRIAPRDGGRWRSLQIEVATVDAFQGRECDIVIYSIVRSNPSGRIGFLHDYRRINVALSRARHLLVIVGDDFMMRSISGQTRTNPFASVLQHIQTHPEGCGLELVRSVD